MGSLHGHVLSGLTFAVYGLIWIILSLWLELKGSHSSTKTIIKDRSLQPSYIPLPLFRCLPIEPICKILFPLISIITEVLLTNPSSQDGRNHIIFKPWSMYTPDGTQFAELNKLEHITMCMAFIISGVIDILVMIPRFSKNSKMVKISRLFFSLVFLVQCFLWYSHSHGQLSLYTASHKLTICITLVTFIVTLLRVFHPLSFIINACIGITIAIQGTWLIQIGVILFGPSYWDRHYSNNIQFVYCCFVWHILFNCFIVFFCYWFLSMMCKPRPPNGVDDCQPKYTVMDAVKIFNKEEDGGIEY